MKRYGKWERKVGWIVNMENMKSWIVENAKKIRLNSERYGKYGRKVSWIVKRYGNYWRKVSWIVKRFENIQKKTVKR